MRPLLLIAALAVCVDAQDFELKEGDAPPTVPAPQSKTNVYQPSDMKDVKGRDLRKARRLANDDDDWKELDERQREAAIMMIAREIASVRRQKGWRWVKDADVTIYLKQKSLDEAYKESGYLRGLKSKGSIVSDTDTKKFLHPVKQIIKGHAATEEEPGAPLNSLFADNQWEIVAGGEDEKELKRQIDQVIAGLGPGDKLMGFSILSSASTLRCTATENGRPITNLRLSELRALAARKFVVDYLQSKHGVTVDPKSITVHFEGENGNGTSGPADPWGTGDKGNGQPPYANVAEYADHRYVQVHYMIYRDKSTPDRVVYKEQAPVCSSMIVAVTYDYGDLDITIPSIERTPNNKRMQRQIKRDQRAMRRGHCPAERKRRG